MIYKTLHRKAKIEQQETSKTRNDSGATEWQTVPAPHCDSICGFSLLIIFVLVAGYDLDIKRRGL